ncbi:MAG: hypothetical protein R8K48_06960 [Gallionella sp.]
MLAYSNWAVLTVSFVVVLSLALSGVALCSVLHLVGAKWRYNVRDLASSLYALFPVAFILMIILLVGGSHTFPWWDQPVGPDARMPGWYQHHWLESREVIGMMFMMVLYWVFIKRQAASDNSSEEMAKFHSVATWIPFCFVLYSTMVAWDFEMTLVPNFHSAIYGMQQFVSNFGMFLAFLVIWIYTLNKGDKLVKPLPEKLYNYLAQMMLAFTLLYIYTYYAQYLTIWYGNIPDETDRIFGMMFGDYEFVWWAVLALKFVFPFSALCFPFTRHNPAAIMTVASSIIVGTVLERFIWIAGVTGKGPYPILAALIVGGVVFLISFAAVRGYMGCKNILKG